MGGPIREVQDDIINTTDKIVAGYVTVVALVEGLKEE